MGEEKGGKSGKGGGEGRIVGRMSVAEGGTGEREAEWRIKRRRRREDRARKGGEPGGKRVKLAGQARTGQVERTA